MRSVSAIKITLPLLLAAQFLLIGKQGVAQENSPYSRYGWGNMVPSTPISTRGMGGISAGYVDYDKRYDFKQVYPKSQAINFLNPASYSRLKITSFDLGLEMENQVLKSQNSTDKYKATYANISYMQLGIPLSRKKNFGMVLGLRPISRINYNIYNVAPELNPETGEYIDSTVTTYEGTGGSYQAYTGFGKAFGNLSIGVNLGYYFGTKDYSTRKEFISDINPYYKGNYQTKINFGGLFVHGGAQYAMKLNSTMKMVVGATASFGKKFDATQDVIRETFRVDASGVKIGQDSIYVESDVKGSVEFPASYTAGFTLEQEDKWMIGMDVVQTNWDNFRVFGQKDSVASNWKIKIGGQFVPNAFGTNYWGRVTYRLGFNYGPDYIRLRDQELNQYSVTAGFGFPIRPNRFSNQYTNLNLAFEYFP
jgi:hypothetical protein